MEIIFEKIEYDQIEKAKYDTFHCQIADRQLHMLLWGFSHLFSITAGNVFQKM